MYETFYGLTRRPFGAAPDARCFVPLDGIRTAHSGLERCLRLGQGIAILTAPAGSGKTLVCRRLLSELRGTFATVFLPTANFPTRRSLLQAILYELERPYAGLGEQEARLELASAVRGLRPRKQGLVLVVDEAHRLSERLLEELRCMTNLSEPSDDGEPLVRLLLSGHLLLEEKLAGPELDSLNQRVGCQATLEPLTRRESAEFIARRLEWAGGDVSDVFTPDAAQMICQASDGVPRCLNQLCDHALLLGYVSEERPVRATTVREALEDLKQLPLHWNEPAAGRADVSTELAPHHDRAAAEWDLEGPVPPLPTRLSGEPQWREPAIEAQAEGAVEVAADCGVIEIGGSERAGAPARAGGLGVASDPPAGQPDGRAFDEEPVLDRYALLDAGRPVAGFPCEGAGGSAGMRSVVCVDALSVLRDEERRLEARGPSSLDQPPPRDAAPEPETGAAGMEREKSRDGLRPDQVIDRLLPMLEAAIHDPPDGPASERNDRPEGRPPFEEKGFSAAPPQEEEWPADHSDHVELAIGSLVLDACLEAQDAITARLAGPDEAAASLSVDVAPDCCAPHFDVPASAWDDLAAVEPPVPLFDSDPFSRGAEDLATNRDRDGDLFDDGRLDVEADVDGYDVVQPEPVCDAGLRPRRAVRPVEEADVRLRDRAPAGALSGEPLSGESRPYQRLFSELRRRRHGAPES